MTPTTRKRKVTQDILQNTTENDLKKTKSNDIHTSKPAPKLADLYNIHVTIGDGACLFRSILYSLIKDNSEHDQLRQNVCDYMLEHRSQFDGFVRQEKQTFDSYIAKMRIASTWGDNPELIAASEMLQFNVVVLRSRSIEIIYQHSHSPTFPTIYLEYFSENHYNSLEPKPEGKINVDLRSRAKTKGVKNPYKSFLSKMQKKYTLVDYDTKKMFHNFNVRMNDDSNGEEKQNTVNDIEVEELVKESAKTRQKRSIKIDEDDEEKQNITNGIEVKRLLKECTKTEQKGSIEESIQSDARKKVVVNSQSQGLYTKAKGNNNTYNEAYRYLRYYVTPNRIEKPTSLANWKRDTEANYYLVENAKSTSSESRLIFRSKLSGDVTIPLKDEIPDIIAKAHNKFDMVSIKHNGIHTVLHNIQQQSLYCFSTSTENGYPSNTELERH